MLISFRGFSAILDPERFNRIVSERIEKALNHESRDFPSRPDRFGNIKGYDCEGLASYIKSGVIACLALPREDSVYPINNKNFVENSHEKYAGYAIYEKSQLAGSETKWQFQHFYIFLGNFDGKSYFLSKNGFGPVRLFKSFEEMLAEDGFPLKRHELSTMELGEQKIFGREDYTE